MSKRGQELVWEDRNGSKTGSDVRRQAFARRAASLSCPSQSARLLLQSYAAELVFLLLPLLFT